MPQVQGTKYWTVQHKITTGATKRAFWEGIILPIDFAGQVQHNVRESPIRVCEENGQGDSSKDTKQMKPGGVI